LSEFDRGALDLRQENIGDVAAKDVTESADVMAGNSSEVSHVAPRRLNLEDQRPWASSGRHMTQQHQHLALVQVPGPAKFEPDIGRFVGP
jgi:hypothetical protein